VAVAGAVTATAFDRAGTGVFAATLTSEELPALPAAVEVAAYRIVVEAVTNIVRHARARSCQVSVALASAALTVTVTDDGIGLPAEDGHGHGLAIMRERAEELGGTVTVRSSPTGVMVQARLPTVTAPAQVPRGPAVPA
jgi:signal transduction histidine kinase